MEKLTVDRKDQSKVPAKYYERLGLKKPAAE